MRTLLIDLDLPPLRPLSRFHSVFSIRNGIYNPIQRIKLLNHNSRSNEEIYFLHPDIIYENDISLIEGLLPFQKTKLNRPNIKNWFNDLDLFNKETAELQKNFSFIHFSSELNILHFFNELNNLIGNDLHLWIKHNDYLDFTKKNSNKKINSYKFEIIGEANKLYIHKKTKISSGCIFDTTNGPIIICHDVEIRPFSYLRGPLYIAPLSQIDNANISSSIIGKNTRLGGEIDHCIIGDYSNKHHEGFIGHSFLGAWVNLGALTTTSDLKNNYGIVKLNLPIENNLKNFFEYDTKQIKFGSIIGDGVKCGIGTMLNTGTVIDAGSNIFNKNPPKYLPPFIWGPTSDLQNNKYDINKFIENSKKIAERRNYLFQPIWDKIVTDLYNKFY